MNMKEVRAAAKELLKEVCRVCPVCNGKACAGEVPGMGGCGSGEAFMENVRALAAVKLHLRCLHAAAACDTSFEFFGFRLSMPVLAAPMAGAALNMGGKVKEEDMVFALQKGSRQAGTMSFGGDGLDPSLYDAALEGIKKVDGEGIPTAKPRSVEKVLAAAAQAKAANCPAFAVDVDMAGFCGPTNGNIGPRSPDEIRDIVRGAGLPVILKGIMTPDEALLAADLGAAGIVVSNHGGRVFDAAPGTAEVLPGIADAAKGRIMILLDGGVRSGTDVLKALALGADAVLIGRPLLVAAAGGGAEGVALYFETIRADLIKAMHLTGTECTAKVCRGIARLPRA